MNFFYDDTVHALQNNNTYGSLAKFAIKLKSDLQLNMKLAMSNIVKMASVHMQPSMHNTLILGNLREYCNKYSTAEIVGVFSTSFT